MRIAVLIAGITLVGTVSAADAPFCVVTASGNSCFYYNASSCQQAAAAINGMCVANQRQQQPVNGAKPSMFESWSRGREAGDRRRREEEEHRARMDLITAQTAAARPQAGGIRVKFLCPDGQGGSVETHYPALGCTVIEIVPTP